MTLKSLLPSVLLAVASCTALALPQLTIVNHTPNAIAYHIQRDDHSTLIAHGQDSAIGPQAHRKLGVKYNETTCKIAGGSTNPSAYISAGWMKDGTLEYDDFFGTGRGCTEVHQDKHSVYTYGYLSSHKLAFSMYNAEANHGARIIFCTTESYVKNGNHCI